MVNKEILEKYSITLPEFLMMYLSLHHVDMVKTVEDITQKGLGVHNTREPYKLIPTNKTEDVVKAIIVESDKVVINQKDRFEQLAVKLQEIYPKGNKPGTTYAWRDSKIIIARRLKMLVKKYGNCFTDEEAIDATRRYVASFNGDTTYMKVLKYFIFKNDRKNGEVEESSQLLSYIDNVDDDILNNDWTSHMTN